MKKIKRFIHVTFTYFCISMILYGCSSDAIDFIGGIATDENHTQTETESKTNATDTTNALDLNVHFIDVGQGDCTLLTCGDQTMLIDAGDNNKGSTIATYLKKNGIKTLDIVVGTHNDADHVGGLDVILYQFDCKNVILSKFAKDNKTYDDVIQTCKNKNYKIQYPEQGTEYTLGDAKVTILSDPNYKADSANNSSISLLVTHYDNAFLFTGDSEEEAELELLKNNNFADMNIEVLKVGHHGSKTSTSEDFLKSVNPTYAVISCGEDNSYKHPHAATLNAIRGSHISMFRTDKQGTIVATSNGTDIAWNMSESNDWTAGE